MSDYEQPRGKFIGVKKYILSIVAGEPQVEVESKLLSYSIGSLAVLVIATSIAYVTILKGIVNIAAYLPLIFLAILTTVATLFSYNHIRCHRKSMLCMNGMMVGMTIGMMIGFMVGAIIGATNGMFLGSIAGMAVGIGLGLNTGRYSGIMGAMEGVMAGFMSGIMGAMTSIMMLRDNLVLFLYILFGIAIFLIGGLSYMLHREEGSAQKTEMQTNFLNFIAMCVLFSMILMAIMIYGPRGILVYP
ncbi:MAG: hypothetical protein Q7S22_01140 [Candidatus Micrarchaeota archaeon]|nr:hypothetical protein [Candidatus Micrarchaeota archaeon]